MRLNTPLGGIVPSLLGIYLFEGSWFVYRDVVPHLWQEERRFFAAVYAFVYGILTLATTITYFRVYSLPWNHSRVTSEVPAEVLNKQIIYECSDLDGTPIRCFQGRCKGSWKPLRSRHCKDCGICQRTFDHHCPWFDSCITLETTLKPFIQFITVVPFLLSWALVPLISLIGKQVYFVFRNIWLDRENAWMYEHWWDLKRSWIFGPGWRWMGGLYYAFQYVSLQRPPKSFKPNRLSQPTFSSFLLVMFAILILILSLMLLYSQFWQLSHGGLSSVEFERTKLWNQFLKRGRRGYDPSIKLFVPLSKGRGQVIFIPPTYHLYDRGFRENWKMIMGMEWQSWFSGLPSPDRGKVTEITEAWKVRLQEEARNVQTT